MLKKLFILIFAAVIFTSCASFQPASKTEKNVKSTKDDNYYSKYNNNCCGWGYRKTENGPEFTEQQCMQMKENNCIYMGNKKGKNLYLTFDEGYENGYTSVILDVLREKNVPAAFFVTGAYVKSEPELIKRMAREGHIIGNHTVNHPSVPSVATVSEINSELTELDRLVFDVCGQNCKYFRPPKGEYSERTLAITKDMGYINTFWSFAYVDWDNKVSAQQAEESVLKGIFSGCVLLLHAVSKGNADALGNIIEKAQKEGYCFKSLDEYIPQ